MASKFGFVPQALHERIKKADGNSGKRHSAPTAITERFKARAGENWELRQDNEISHNSEPPFRPR